MYNWPWILIWWVCQKNESETLFSSLFSNLSRFWSLLTDDAFNNLKMGQLSVWKIVCYSESASSNEFKLLKRKLTPRFLV